MGAFFSIIVCGYLNIHRLLFDLGKKQNGPQNGGILDVSGLVAGSLQSSIKTKTVGIRVVNSPAFHGIVVHGKAVLKPPLLLGYERLSPLQESGNIEIVHLKSPVGCLRKPALSQIESEKEAGRLKDP
jgi:hypothetical protein